MESESSSLSYAELLQLLAGDPVLRARLGAGDTFRVETPFFYPGRGGPVTLHLGLAPETDRGSSSPIIRISDGGGLIKCLSEQGMDLELDMVLSKTVFHAVREMEDAGIIGGQVYLDSPDEQVGAGVWRFLQLVAEVVGLRHAKYKDALLQLERRRSADSGLAGWRPT